MCAIEEKKQSVQACLIEKLMLGSMPTKQTGKYKVVVLTVRAIDFSDGKHSNSPVVLPLRSNIWKVFLKEFVMRRTTGRREKNTMQLENQSRESFPINPKSTVNGKRFRDHVRTYVYFRAGGY